MDSVPVQNFIFPIAERSVPTIALHVPLYLGASLPRNSVVDSAALEDTLWHALWFKSLFTIYN